MASNDDSTDTPAMRARTDAPATELLLGIRGVRRLHKLVYSLVFCGLLVASTLVFATLATGFWMLGYNLTRLSGSSPPPTGSLFDGAAHQFGHIALSPTLLLVAMSVALLGTLPVIVWNELRYQRGEWIRSYL